MRHLQFLICICHTVISSIGFCTDFLSWTFVNFIIRRYKKFMLVKLRWDSSCCRWRPWTGIRHKRAPGQFCLKPDTDLHRSVTVEPWAEYNIRAPFTSYSQTVMMLTTHRQDIHVEYTHASDDVENILRGGGMKGKLKTGPHPCAGSLYHWPVPYLL